MLTTLKTLFQSKKFLAMISGVAVYAANRFGFEVAQADADRILALFALYIGSVGLTDFGKEAAKHKAAGPS